MRVGCSFEFFRVRHFSALCFDDFGHGAKCRAGVKEPSRNFFSVAFFGFAAKFKELSCHHDAFVD